MPTDSVDLILQAIRGGNTGVSDEEQEPQAPFDKILAAIRTGGSKPVSGLRTPSLDELTTGTSPETQTPSLTTRAASLNRAAIPLRSPSIDTTQFPLNVFSGSPQEPGMATQDEIARSGVIRAPGKIRLPGPHGVPVEIPEDTGEGVVRMLGAGAPEGSAMANIAGVRGTKDNVRLLAPEELLSQSEQQQHPILTGALEFAGGMTTPENLALLGLTAGAGEIAGPGAPVVKRLLAAGFSIPTLIGAARQAPEVSDAFRRGDTYNAQRLLTHVILGASVAGLAGRGMFEEAAPAVPGYENVGESSVLGARSRETARSASGTQPGVGTASPSPNSSAGANKSPIPERPETLKAQVDALAAGTNPIVYFPRGTGEVPQPPDGAQVTIVPGNHDGAGTYYHSEDITPEHIKSAVENGTHGSLLGYVQTKQEAESGSPAALVARDANGTELKAAVVDTSNAEAMREQTRELQLRFPDAKVAVEPFENVIAWRRGLGLRTDASAPETGLSPQTQAPDANAETQAKPSFETRALDELLAPHEENFAGTQYSGLSPAALKRLLPEGVRERLDTEVEGNQRARSLQGQLYDLESQNAADLIRARDVLKEAPGTPADMEAIYHHLENPREPLSGEQQRILDGYIQPLADESARINQKLGGGEVENYVHRISIGKGGLLDRIIGGEGGLGGIRGLSKSAASLRGRTMMALEDGAGNRRVVSIKDGNVTAFDDGEAENIGSLQRGLKSRGDILDAQLEPMRQELAKLETERDTLTATKSREAAARRRIQNIDDRAAEIREALQDSYRADDGHLLSEDDLRGGVFVDKNGKEWKLTQATTKEIEANTNVRYYKNALASTVLNYLNIRKAERAYDFLESYKNSPDFLQAAIKIKGDRIPSGWRGTEIPQFHGYAFEPHTAEVLDWYAKRMRVEGANLYTQIGNFLRTSIFFNPLIHTPNIGVHWIVEKGLTGVGPQNWGRILRTGSRAIDAVIHQNSDFLAALDAGAPLQSARLDNGATTRLLLERMGRELEANPTAAQRVARALGYANPVKLVRSIYNFSSKVTWVSNDIAMLQAAYEHMERTNGSFKEAMADVSKHIPDYRLPTRIFNSTTLAKLMSNSNLTMFGAYHYGALRSYAEMAKGLFSEDMSAAERMKGIDRLAMLGLFTFVVYPQLDKLAKLITADKTAEFRRAGASTFIYNLAQLARGEKTPTEVLESVVTPAVHTKAVVQLALNRDLRTGRKIYDTNAPAGEMAKQVGRYAANAISPVQQGSRVLEGKQTAGQSAAGLAGIRTKVKTPAERLASSLAMDRTPPSPPGAGQLEKSKIARDLEDQIRQGKLPTQELGNRVRRGEITEDQAVKIFRNVQTPPLVRDFKRLPIEDGLKVWAKASDEERQALRPILEAKAWRLDREKYTSAEWKALLGKLRTAFTGRVPATPPIPRASIPFSAPM